MRNTPAPRPAAVVALLGAACFALASSAGAEQPPAGVPLLDEGGHLATLSIDEVRRGQKGYGLSVFSGQELERFEVEVLGVMRNSSPDVSYVLARLSGQGLEDSGVIAGMSGSPVFLDDRLVGAVAFSWPFAREAIAGITPIEAMRNLSGTAAGAIGRPASFTLDDVLRPSRLSTDVLAEELARLQRPVGGPQASSILGWGIGGFGAETGALLARGLGTTMPSGEMLAGGEAGELVPGSAVAAVLVDGDLRLAATGTVTDRRGDEVLAFGHPFLGLGAIDVPMAEAEVVTVLSNQYNSFKIANFGRTVGAFQEDRLAGIRGRLGASAPTIPMTVAVSTPERREYRMQVARVPQLTPLLMALSVLGAQESAAQTAGPLGLDLVARFDLGEHGDLELAQSFDGANAPTDAAVYLLAFTGFMLQNSWAAIDLQGLEVEVSHHAEPRTAMVVGGHADRTEVRPGEEVRLHLELMPFRGEMVRQQTTIRLPSDLPAGQYSLLVGDGVTLDNLRNKIEQAPPVTFEQVLRVLSRFHSRRDLVVLGLNGGQGLSVGGEVMPRLPGSMQSVWAAASSRGAVPLRLQVAQEQVLRMDRPIEGAVRIDLQVRRRQPLTATGADQGVGEAGEESTTPDEGAASAAESGGQPAAEAAPAGESPEN